MTTDTTRTPWDAPEFFPPKPPGSDFGFWAGNRENPCTREELARETARGVSMVWTPDAPRYVTSWEVPFLGEALRARTLFTLAQRLKSTLGWLVLLGALAAMRWGKPEFPMYAAMAVFMGLVPMIELLRTRGRLRRGILDAPEMAGQLRFQLWMLRRPRSAGWVLGACIAAAGVWQVAVGTRSFEFAAHVKVMVFEGEPWRLLTGALLHANLMHFVLNGLALIVLAKMVEALSSRFHVFLVFTVSLVTGSLGSLYLSRAPATVGASGAILGLLGFLVVLSLRRPGALPRGIRTWFAMMVVSVVVLGAAAWNLIDNAGHAGGFAGGALLGWLLVPRVGDFPIRAGRGVRVFGAVALAVVLLTTLALPLTPRGNRIRQISLPESSSSVIGHPSSLAGSGGRSFLNSPVPADTLPPFLI